MGQLWRSFLLLGCALVSSGSAASALATEDAAACIERSLRAEEFDPASLRATLEGLGPKAIPALFAIFASGEVGQGAARRTLDQGHELLVLAALCRQPQALRFLLGSLVNSDADQPERLAAMRLLERAGGVGDLRLALNLAPRTRKAAGVERRVKSALIQTLGAIDRRQPESLELLLRLYPAAPRGTLPSLIGFIAGHPSARAAEQLAGLLDAVPDADALLLLELGKLMRGSKQPLSDQALKSIRKCLDAREPTKTSLAAVLLGTQRDSKAVPHMIELLGESARLGAGAHAQLLDALEAISGCRPGTTREVWGRWLQLEESYWNQKAHGLKTAVATGTPQESIAAIRELAKHRLYSAEVATALLTGLQRKDVEVVRLSCNALLQLCSPLSIDGLLEALRHSDQPVRLCAWRALKEHTGYNLPPDHDTWKALLKRDTGTTESQVSLR